MKYKMADVVFEMEPKYDLLKERSQKYLCSDSQKTDFMINVTDEQIEKEKLTMPNTTTGLAEYMAIGAEFYKNLLNHYNGCVLHSAAVVIDKEAYLFSAPCGTGKSTHVALWVKYLASKNPYILNDDNPALRILDDGIYAYGTPFSGKHDINENKKAKVKGICFLEQAKTNSITKIEPQEAIQRFLDQTIRDLESDEMLKLLDILDKILKEIPVYKLCCNMSEEAVQLSYQTMKGGLYEN